MSSNSINTKLSAGSKSISADLTVSQIYTESVRNKITQEILKEIDFLKLNNNPENISRTTILIRHPKIEEISEKSQDKKYSKLLKNSKELFRKDIKKLKPILVGNKEIEFYYNSGTQRIVESKNVLKENFPENKFIDDERLSTWDRAETTKPRQELGKIQENIKSLGEEIGDKDSVYIVNSTFAGVYQATAEKGDGTMKIDPKVLEPGEIKIYNFNKKGDLIEDSSFLELNQNNIKEILEILGKDKYFEKIVSFYKKGNIDFKTLINGINHIFKENYLYKRFIDSQNIDLSDFCISNLINNSNLYYNFIEILKTRKIQDFKNISKTINNSAFKAYFISNISSNSDEDLKIFSYYISKNNDDIEKAFNIFEKNNFIFKKNSDEIERELRTLFSRNQLINYDSYLGYIEKILEDYSSIKINGIALIEFFELELLRFLDRETNELLEVYNNKKDELEIQQYNFHIYTIIEYIKIIEKFENNFFDTKDSCFFGERYGEVNGKKDNNNLKIIDFKNRINSKYKKLNKIHKEFSLRIKMRVVIDLFRKIKNLLKR